MVVDGMVIWVSCRLKYGASAAVLCRLIVRKRKILKVERNVDICTSGKEVVETLNTRMGGLRVEGTYCFYLHIFQEPPYYIWAEWKHGALNGYAGWKSL